jgi:hypothetical protein
MFQLLNLSVISSLKANFVKRILTNRCSWHSFANPSLLPFFPFIIARSEALILFIAMLSLDFIYRNAVT